MIDQGMPPDILLQDLPEKGIPTPSRIAKPLVLLREDAVPTAIEDGKLGAAAKIVAEHTTDPAVFVNTLLELKELSSVVGFFAWSLPPRLALWWAFDSGWSALLDRDRHRARRAAARGKARGVTKTRDPDKKPMTADEKLQADPELKKRIAKEQKRLSSEMQGGMSFIEEQHMKVAQALDQVSQYASRAPLPTAGASGAAAVEFEMRIQRLKILAAETISKAKQIPPNPVHIKCPGAKQGEVEAPATPKKEPAQGGIPDLADRIAQARREGRLRALASCLQWILDPCQKNAIIAAQASQQSENCPIGAALAKATFWCGENLNVDLSKPVVVPPSTLPHKGVQASMVKAISLKECSWSAGDKNNWFISRAILISQGRLDWDGASERFHTYNEWAMGRPTNGDISP